MGSSASTDTFPADVAETRRAAGITIAPEAALHRALQERTDELERVRVRADLTAEKAFSALVQRRLVEARAERDAAQSARDAARSAWTDLREAQATLQAAYDGLGAAAEVRVVTATRAPVVCVANPSTSSNSCPEDRPTWIDVLSHGGACALCGGGVALGAWAACGGVR